MSEPAKEPTEKQKKYAESLGITISAEDSSYTLSRKIKAVLDKNRPKKEDSGQQVFGLKELPNKSPLFTAALDLKDMNIHETKTFEIRIKRLQ